MREYDKILEDQRKKDLIEEVNLEISTEKVHYLPHFAVLKEDSSTTKMRIVYDASAKSNKQMHSLNDLLYSGPSLLPELVAILIKFRLYPIALVADVEKAFLQIILDSKDRDSTRFIWLKDIHGDVVENNISHLRFRRVLFGATPSPFLMNATFLHHLMSYPDWVAKAVAESLYSDNLVGGVDLIEQGHHYHKRSKEIFRDAREMDDEVQRGQSHI